MIAKALTKIGNITYQFEFDDKEEMEAMAKAIIMGNPPTKCNVCKNSDPATFILITNKDKESNIYIKVACLCGAKADLGQYKSGGFFWHKFEVWNGSKGDKADDENLKL
jgi:hypothetical protein